MAKAKYTANSRIIGLLEKPVEFGAIVEVDEKAAAALVACGALVPTKPSKTEEQAPTSAA